MKQDTLYQTLYKILYQIAPKSFILACCEQQYINMRKITSCCVFVQDPFLADTPFKRTRR